MERYIGGIVCILVQRRAMFDLLSVMVYSYLHGFIVLLCSLVTGFTGITS